MAMVKEYEFSVDLVFLLQILMALSTVIYLVRYVIKRQVSFPLVALLSLFLFLLGNSFFLRFTDIGLFNLIPAFLLCAGPFFWWFLKTFLHGDTKSAMISYHHFAPGFLGIGLYLLIDPYVLEPYQSVFIFLHSGFYIFNSTLVVIVSSVKKTGSFREELSFEDRKRRTSWYILSGVYLIYIMAFLETFIIHPLQQYRFIFVVVFLVFAVLVLRHIFSKVRYIYQVYKKRSPLKKAEKYSGSLLTALQSKTLSEQLEALMQNQKPYLNDTLELSTLAQILKTHPKNLSQAINENFQRNFFDYVNTYRVQEAQRLLADPSRKDHKIYEIMFEVGFNSRSSFNTAFKKVTGLTAGQYRKEYMKT